MNILICSEPENYIGYKLEKEINVEIEQVKNHFRSINDNSSLLYIEI